MARVEKTVFISYRRVDGAWALSVFNWLTQQGYDVFIDYDGTGAGAFESVILGKIRSWAHFLVVLSPSALERCREPEDLFRREIETALASGRNIVPLMVEGFSFQSPAVATSLAGALKLLPEYNGLEVEVNTFLQAMQRLSKVFLRVPLAAVLHPPGALDLQAAARQQAAADGAVSQARPSASVTRRVLVTFAVFLARWFKPGLGLSAVILIVAIAFTQSRSAPFLVEREIVGAIVAMAAGSCMLWILAGKIFAKDVRGLLPGLLAGLVTAYVLLRQVDLYPVSDISRQFALQNPNDPWSYGYARSGSSELTLFDDRFASDDLERFHLLVPGYASIPEVLHNRKAYTVRLGAVRLPPRVVELHPGWLGERAVVRWTARRAGVYRISGYFIGLNEERTTTDVHVICKQSESLFASEISSFGVPATFDVVRKLDVGDVVDFAVGYGTTGEPNPTNDSTGLAAWVGPVE